MYSIMEEEDGKDSPQTFKKISLRFYIKLLLMSQARGYPRCREARKYSHLVRQKCAQVKNQSSLTEDKETRYWEVTGSLCPNRHFVFWSAAFPVFCVVSVSLAHDLVIQVSRISRFFSKNLSIY